MTTGLIVTVTWSVLVPSELLIFSANTKDVATVTLGARNVALALLLP